MLKLLMSSTALALHILILNAYAMERSQWRLFVFIHHCVSYRFKQNASEYLRFRKTFDIPLPPSLCYVTYACAFKDGVHQHLTTHGSFYGSLLYKSEGTSITYAHALCTATFQKLSTDYTYINQCMWLL